MTRHPLPADHPLFQLPPLREVIAAHGLDARKALGQNFLLDGNITDKIARSAGPLENMRIVEVGPGPGGLTRSLLMMGAAEVIAIEKDPRCMAALAELAEAAEGRLHVQEADALTVDVTSLCDPPRRIIANLPYNVATPLLIGWLKQIRENPACLDSMTLMFQREVADRITAAPGSKSYGRLSVMSQWVCEVRHGFDLPPSVFTPPPKVTSSVVHLAPRETLVDDVPWQALEKLVECAFNQRRKMLRSSLKALGVDTEALLEAAHIPATERAEQLSVAQFCALTRQWMTMRSPG